MGNVKKISFILRRYSKGETNLKRKVYFPCSQFVEKIDELSLNFFSYTLCVLFGKLGNDFFSFYSN